MSTPFQNRLVGTIIVAAAVVIFLPDVLDGEKKSYQADFEPIPKAPAFVAAPNRKTFPQDKLVIKTENAADQDEIAIDEDLVVNETDNEPNIVTTNKSDTTTKVTVLSKEKATDTTITASKPVEKNTATPGEAWVIHLGSFKHKKNVDELLAKLKANGYTAFTQPINTKNGVLTKVIVGPSLNKAELLKNIPELKTLTSVQGKLAQFEVN